MDYPAAAVTALKGLVQLTVVHVKLGSEVYHASHIVRTLFDQHLDRFWAVFVSACYHGILDMQLVAVVYRVEHGSHAALCKVAVAKPQIPFADHEGRKSTVKIIGGIKPGKSGADYKYIIFIAHRKRPLL